jgi:hypothetical protein
MKKDENFNTINYCWYYIILYLQELEAAPLPDYTFKSPSFNGRDTLAIF